MDVPTTTNTCIYKLNIIVNVLQPFINAHVFKDDVRVEVRPRDFPATTTTYVNVDGSIIAEINLQMNHTPKRSIGDWDASVFKVRAAKGVDLSLVR